MLLRRKELLHTLDLFLISVLLFLNHIDGIARLRQGYLKTIKLDILRKFIDRVEGYVDFNDFSCF